MTDEEVEADRPHRAADDLERAALFDKIFTPKMIDHLRMAARALRACAAEKARADALEAQCAVMQAYCAAYRATLSRAVAAFTNGGGLGHIAAEMEKALDSYAAGKRFLEEHAAALAAKDARIAELVGRYPDVDELERDL